MDPSKLWVNERKREETFWMWSRATAVFHINPTCAYWAAFHFCVKTRNVCVQRDNDYSAKLRWEGTMNKLYPWSFLQLHAKLRRTNMCFNPFSWYKKTRRWCEMCPSCSGECKQWWFECIRNRWEGYRFWRCVSFVCHNVSEGRWEQELQQHWLKGQFTK